LLNKKHLLCQECGVGSLSRYRIWKQKPSFFVAECNTKTNSTGHTPRVSYCTKCYVYRHICLASTSYHKRSDTNTQPGSMIK